MMAAKTWKWFMLLCFSIFTQNSVTAESYVELKMQSSESGRPISLYSFEQFGFAKGGTFTFNLTSSFEVMSSEAQWQYYYVTRNREVLFYLLACPPDQHNAIHGPDFERIFLSYCDGMPKGEFNEYSESYCRAFPFSNATLDPLSNTVKSYLNISNEELTEERTLNFAVTNCFLDDRFQFLIPLQIYGSYEFKNPGQWYLSTLDAPNLTLYIVTTVTWVSISIGWWIGTIQMRRKVDMSLHYLMGSYPVSKSLFAMHACISWFMIQQGLASHKSPQNFYFPIFLILRVMYLISFSASLLLIGKGWKLSRDNLHPVEHRNVIFMTIVFSISAFLLGIWDSGQQRGSSFASFAFLALAYVVILYSVWYSVTQNILALKIHLRTIELFGIAPQSTPIFQTHKIFVQFRGVFFSYLVGGAVADIVVATLFNGYPWVRNLSNEVIEFVAALFVGITFRPRELKCRLERIDGNGNVVRREIQPVSPAAEPGNSLQTWEEGMELPANPRSDMLFSTSSQHHLIPRVSNAVAPQAVEMVTIVNPGESEPTALGCRVKEKPSKAPEGTRTTDG